MTEQQPPPYSRAPNQLQRNRRNTEPGDRCAVRGNDVTTDLRTKSAPIRQLCRPL